jgi:putative membrane protein
MKTNRLACLFAAGLIAAALAVPNFADHHGDKEKDLREIELDDKSLVKISGHAHLLATQYGQLAQRKGDSMEVRQFGQKMISDHREAHQQIRPLAQELEVTLPVSVKDKYQERLQELEALSGQEFDREFAKDMIKGHRMHITLYERAQEKVENEQLKTYVEESLPKLNAHLQAAENMARNLGIDADTIAQLGQEAAEAAGAPGVVIEERIEIEVED